MTAFDVAAGSLFADRNLASDAVYRAGGIGPGTAIRAARRAPDDLASFGEARFVTSTVILELLVAAAPDLAAGDRIQIGAVIYEVRAEPIRDAERLIWTAEVREL